MLVIGRYRIRSVVLDLFRLDGGAMFGSVPKTLWSRLIPADEKNRIQLCCRVLVVEDGDRRILIDCGMGRKWRDKEREIFAIEHLTDNGAADVLGSPTHIILTHLHFDHAGGITSAGSDGHPALTFPNAEVFVSRKNYDHARNPGVRERASYLAENIAPLAAGKLRLTEDNEEILPGITVQQFHGHTPGLQIVTITDGGRSLVYLADVIPTAHHIQVPYVMGYDLCAQTSMDEKSRLLTQSAPGTIFVFEHDNDTIGGTISLSEEKKFRLEPHPELNAIAMQERAGAIGTPAA